MRRCGLPAARLTGQHPQQVMADNTPMAGLLPSGGHAFSGLHGQLTVTATIW
jgi:hypothetical protein